MGDNWKLINTASEEIGNRVGIKKIIIPEGNLRDLDEIPTEVKDNIEYVVVKNYKEIYDKFLEGEK